MGGQDDRLSRRCSHCPKSCHHLPPARPRPETPWVRPARTREPAWAAAPWPASPVGPCRRSGRIDAEHALQSAMNPAIAAAHCCHTRIAPALMPARLQRQPHDIPEPSEPIHAVAWRATNANVLEPCASGRHGPDFVLRPMATPDPAARQVKSPAKDLQQRRLSRAIASLPPHERCLPGKSNSRISGPTPCGGVGARSRPAHHQLCLHS